MTYVLVGAIGLLIGLAGHDLAIQALSAETPLRPLTGVCRVCRKPRGWHRARCPLCSGPVTREPVVAVASALVAVGFYVTLALIFAATLAFFGDTQSSLDFLTGWAMEYSLSIDNLFVFVLIMSPIAIYNLTSGFHSVQYAEQVRTSHADGRDLGPDLYLDNLDGVVTLLLRTFRRVMA